MNEAGAVEGGAGEPSGAGFNSVVGGIALFAGGYALIDLLPVLLPESQAVLGLRWGDLADAALVFALGALYIRLAMQADLWRTPLMSVFNALAFILLVQGHSIHLTANAIAAVTDTTSPSWSLVNLLDEHWGHVELHLAFIMFAAFFIANALDPPHSAARSLSTPEKIGLAVSILTYGTLLAGDAIEGQTVALMLPAGIILAAWGLVLGARRARSLHRLFFAASFGVATVALVIYGLANAGYPQLSSL